MNALWLNSIRAFYSHLATMNMQCKFVFLLLSYVKIYSWTDSCSFFVTTAEIMCLLRTSKALYLLKSFEDFRDFWIFVSSGCIFLCTVPFIIKTTNRICYKKRSFLDRCSSYISNGNDNSILMLTIWLIWETFQCTSDHNLAMWWIDVIIGRMT